LNNPVTKLKKSGLGKIFEEKKFKNLKIRMAMPHSRAGKARSYDPMPFKPKPET
jgi:hypothetical protein